MTKYLLILLLVVLESCKSTLPYLGPGILYKSDPSTDISTKQTFLGFTSKRTLPSETEGVLRTEECTCKGGKWYYHPHQIGCYCETIIHGRGEY